MQIYFMQFNAQLLADFHIVFLITAFIIGACVGSFVNVLIDRLPREVSVLTAHSYCFSCQKPIRWFDLIPVFSWFILRGKCRHCGAGFSVRLALIELFMGLFAVLCFLHFDADASLHNLVVALDTFIAATILMAVLVIDWKWWIIPLSLTIALLLNGFLFRLLLLRESWFKVVGGALLGLILFLAIQLFFTWRMRKQGRIEAHESALGWGDVWLAAAIGANVGAVQLFQVVFLASVQGVIVWAALYVLSKFHPMFRKDMPSDIPANSIPFGTFLALATIELRFLPPLFFQFNN